MQTLSPSIQPGAPEKISFLPTQRQFFTLLLIYFALLLTLRTLISETAGIDEADQLVVGQKLSWGYGPHAPLYTWLMILFLKLFGSSEFSLTLLRELLLFGIYTLTYFNARLLTKSHACGVAAAVALQFHPSIVWESQRELTHSIVASMMLLATLLAFFRLRPDRWGAWLALGICGGLSMLSKYNAALFYAAMLLSAVSMPGLRPLVFSRRMAAALPLSLLIIAPNLWWVLHHRDLAFGLVYKFHIEESMPWASAVGKGLWHWLVAVLAHLSPLVLVLTAICWRPIFINRAARFHTDQERFLCRTLLILFAMVLLSVFLLKVTQFKDRWLQPIFVCSPILLIAILRVGLDRIRMKIILTLGLVVTVAMTAMTSGRLFFTEKRGRRDVLNAPFRKFAADLKTSVVPSQFIVAGDYWLAGNLRLWFPDKHLFSPDLAPPNVDAGDHCLLVWDATKRAEPPAKLLEFARAFTNSESLPTPTYIEEPWKYHKTKKMRLGLCVLQNARVKPPV